MWSAGWCTLLGLVALVAAVHGDEPVLRCRHERCHYHGFRYNRHTYDVEDYIINIRTDERYTWINKIESHKRTLTISCTGETANNPMLPNRTSILDSHALPRAEPALDVTYVELLNCPLPAVRSLADTFAALSITLADEPAGPRSALDLTWLYGNKDAPPLAARHFTGLDHLSVLSITAYNTYTRKNAELGFLLPLQNLRSLKLYQVLLTTRELKVPASLQELYLYDVNVERVPVAPALEWLELSKWKEPKPTPLVDCNSLRKLDLTRTEVVALPDGWLANCSHLETLVIIEARNLITLPPKLLIGANALNTIYFTSGALKTLPIGLLDYAPNLRKLFLTGNHLRTLPSNMFAVARQVEKLELNRNELDVGALEALAPLRELTELDLSDNPRLGDLCARGGYSPIRNSTKLTWLSLKFTGVSCICRDWRQDMHALRALSLEHTQMSELSFEELLFTRTKNTLVLLYETTVTAVRTTREEYNTAARRLSTYSPVHFYPWSYNPSPTLPALVCDCRMYWTRRALDLALPALEHLALMSCADGRMLRDVTPEELARAQPELCPELLQGGLK